MTKGSVVLALSLAFAAHPAHAQSRPRPTRPPARTAATPAKADRRGPLDATRSVFIDDQSGVPGALPMLRGKLRNARLWTVTEQRDRAELVLTLAPAMQPAAPRAPQRAVAGRKYEISVRSTRLQTAAPLWRTTAKTPEKAANRLKADLAPSVCVVAWCW
jgi:hypothetical protein